jgi:hypothetical protein
MVDHRGTGGRAAAALRCGGSGEAPRKPPPRRRAAGDRPGRDVRLVPGEVRARRTLRGAERQRPRGAGCHGEHATRSRGAAGARGDRQGTHKAACVATVPSGSGGRRAARSSWRNGVRASTLRGAGKGEHPAGCEGRRGHRASGGRSDETVGTWFQEGKPREQRAGACGNAGNSNGRSCGARPRGRGRRPAEKRRGGSGQR